MTATNESRGKFLFRFLAISLVIFSLAAVTMAASKPVFHPSLKISKTTKPIKIDGKIDDAGWSSAQHITNFVERHPGENLEPQVATEAYITYDNSNIYIAFVCHDDPSKVRATMCQRDRFSSDDNVVVLIDPYGDATRAYEFFVNPYGVQKDALWSSVAGDDNGFDMIWKSAGKITSSGYQVEMAIPFSSIRFPSKDVQVWKVDFWRNHPRDIHRQYSWAAYDQNERCWPCQWGTLEGITSILPGKGVEILPTVIANQSGQTNFDDPSLPFDNSDVDGEMSLGGKYSLSSDITIEGAYNPDFSQIESDADQVDVNTTIALFYPERRPFFQEGRDVFRTLFNSFYTRMVNDPEYAVKLTGRSNSYSFGAMSAQDKNTYYIIPLYESSIFYNTGKSYVNVFRGMQSIGNNSQVGMLVTDRRFENGGYGSIAALDGSIRLSSTYGIVGQYIASLTKEPDIVGTYGLKDVPLRGTKYNAALDGEKFNGYAFITKFMRNSRHWNLDIDYNQVDPTYRTETGYDPTVNYRNFSASTNYTLYPGGRYFDRITPWVYTSTRWDFDGYKKHQNIVTGISSQFKFAQTHFEISYASLAERYNDYYFDNLWEINFDLNSRPNGRIGWYIGYDYGRSFSRSYMIKGNETEAFVSLNVKPIDRLSINTNLNFYRLTDLESGDRIFNGYISRTRFQIQAKKELSFRLVVQYNDFYESWDIDPLMTYRINPFTVFYIGSTYDYSNCCFDDPGKSDWRMTSRQFFMKLQYLFQT